MAKQTKIVATISDIRCEVDFIKSLYKAGMNVVRINTAHIDAEGLERVVNNTRAVSDKIGILMDTKGPEIRTSPCEGKLKFQIGHKVTVSGDYTQNTTIDHIQVSYPDIVKSVAVGRKILFDDGEIEIIVESKDENFLYCKVANDGELGSRKSVNVPNTIINLPSLTEKDRLNIEKGIALNIDFIAHSFVRNAKDVLEIQKILDSQNSSIKIIAKIENEEGVQNIDEILEYAYGVMVARGDLGIEIPMERIPSVQRLLINKCVQAKKPVIVATQMLHTMIKSPRPTRAEVADIANAIYYRTDAIMLSGETAYGDYPLEAVMTMAKIAEEAENNKMGENDIRIESDSDDLDVTSFLAKQAVKACAKLKAAAIITDANTGKTSRYLAAFRGKKPVYAFCYHKEVMRLMSLSYGITASYLPPENYPHSGVQALLDKGLVENQDMLCCIGGSLGTGCGTSYLEISEAETILKKSKAKIEREVKS